jgi:hypothetical protein
MDSSSLVEQLLCFGVGQNRPSFASTRAVELHQEIRLVAHQGLSNVQWLQVEAVLSFTSFCLALGRHARTSPSAPPPPLRLTHALFIPIWIWYAMAIHPLVSMDEFVDSSGRGRWFLGFHAIFSMHIQPVYMVFVRRRGNPMNHRHWPPQSMNSSINTSGWIVVRLKGALGIWWKRACIECQSHSPKDDGAITTASRHPQSMGLTV